MEYTIKALASMAGVTTKTLRHYEEVGLISPRRVQSNGYRIYGKEEVHRLQEILFYKTLEMPLEDIKKILQDKAFDRRKALQMHKRKLLEKKVQMEQLLETIDNSLLEMEGRIHMKDQDKFHGLLKENVTKNEERYGQEIREKYGEEVVEKANDKYLGQSKEAYDKGEALGKEILEKLYVAMETKDPTSKEAKEVAKLHKAWISLYWPVYDKVAHKGLTDLYVTDERFKKYYDEGKEGAAQFLRDSVYAFHEED